MSGFRALVRNVVLSSLRNRTALIFTLLLPIFFMLIFGTLFGGNGPALKVGVVDEDHSQVSAAYLAVLDGQSGLTVETGARADEQDHLKHDRISIVAVIPADFGAAAEQRGALGVRDATITLVQNSSPSQTSAIAQSVLTQLTDAFAQRSQGFQSHITLRTSTISVNRIRSIDFLLPAMIAYIILQAGVQTVAIGLVDLRERKVLRRLRATPLTSTQILGAEILGGSLTVMLQVLVLIALGLTVFGAKTYGSWILAALATVVGIAAFVAIGFLLTSFSRSSEAARGLGAAIAFPMMFLSGIFFPLDSLPDVMQKIVHIFPLTWLSDALHQVLNDGVGVGEIALDLGVLVLWAVVCFALATRRFRWE